MPRAWRVLFVLAALLIIIGGPQHPKGDLQTMLGDPSWFRAHMLLEGGFLSLLLGLVLLRRRPAPTRTRRWLSLAVAGTILQAVEMAFHAAASIDLPNLLAGSPTPVLSTHLTMSVMFYPLFAISMIGLILAGVADGTLGRKWYAWIGIAGAVAHGAAAPLTVAARLPWAPLLFPFLLLLALWLILASAVPPTGAAAL